MKWVASAERKENRSLCHGRLDRAGEMKVLRNISRGSQRDERCFGVPQHDIFAGAESLKAVSTGGTPVARWRSHPKLRNCAVAVAFFVPPEAATPSVVGSAMAKVVEANCCH